MPMPVIRDQLGHSSLAVTDRYLRHVMPADVVAMGRARRRFNLEPQDTQPAVSRPGPEPCPHPKARVIQGLCGACGTNVGSTRRAGPRADRQRDPARRRQAFLGYLLSASSTGRFPGRAVAQGRSTISVTRGDT